MKEGEPILGGSQANPSGTPSQSGAGAQPVGFTPNNTINPTQVNPRLGRNPYQRPAPTRPTIASSPMPQTTQFPTQPTTTPQQPFNQFSGQPVTPQQPIAPNPVATNPVIPNPVVPQPTITPQPISSGTGDIFLSATEPKKVHKRNKLLFIFIIIFIVIIGSVIAFIFVSSGKQDSENLVSKEEVRTALAKFYYGSDSILVGSEEYNSEKNENYPIDNHIDVSYELLIKAYEEDIGLTPQIKVDEDGFSISPFSDNWIKSFSEGVDFVEQSYEVFSKVNSNELSESEKGTLNNIKHTAKANLDIIHSNISILSDFYYAFIVPINDVYFYNNPASCTKTKKMEALINDARTNYSAEKYFDVYCDIVNTRENNNLTMPYTMISDATESLNNVLSTIDQTAIPDIENLLEEL